MVAPIITAKLTRRLSVVVCIEHYDNPNWLSGESASKRRARLVINGYEVGLRWRHRPLSAVYDAGIHLMEWGGPSAPKVIQGAVMQIIDVRFEE